jgi:ribosome-binding protein aMBF1 (putative translation factor)
VTIKFDTLRARWMRDPKFRKAYDRISPEMEIAFAIAEARHRAHLSQHQLAKKIGTSQAAVARWERGSSLPTTSTLRRVASLIGQSAAPFLDGVPQGGLCRHSRQ